MNKTCNFCSKTFVFHNLHTLILQLSCPNTGVGKENSYAKIADTESGLAVKYKYWRRVEVKRAEVEQKKNREKHSLQLQGFQRERKLRLKSEVSVNGG